MVKVFSEIGKLKKILLHEPGEELENLTPKYLGDLLFDDIPYLPLAREEHQAFADAFRKEGIEVVYLVDLISETLDLNLEIKKEFINEFIKDARVTSDTLKNLLLTYLLSYKDTKEMVKKLISGIKKSELPGYEKRNLSDFVGEYPFVTDPIPNLYFTRDPFAIIGNGVSLNKMYSETRSRETIFGEYIFKYHPDYKDTPLYYNRYEDLNIEGGDILVLNDKVLLVGVSERTHPAAIEKLCKNLFYKNETSFVEVLALTLPKMRTFMHLDTIFTQVDYDKFTIHNECYEMMRVFSIKKDSERPGKLKILEYNKKIDEILGDVLGYKVTMIPCGGRDSVSADREQWSDGSNTICIRPGVVIAYERNYITNEVLKSYGIKVITIPSSELSRGRGGPRCMSMPLERESLRK